MTREGNTIIDKPLYKRSAFWHFIVTALTGFGMMFPEWDNKVKFAVMLVQQLATLFIVDQVTHSVDPADLPPTVNFVERDGITPAPRKTFGGN